MTIPLVTGFSGYIGSSVTNYLLLKYDHIYGLSSQGLHRITSSSVSLISFDSINKSEVFCIFHLAGPVNHSSLGTDTSRIFQDHVLSLLDLLDLIPNQRISHVFTFGSSEEFSSSSTFLTEDSPKFSKSPYALCKSTLRSLYHLFPSHIKFCHVYLFLVYGPSSTSQRLVPSAIRSLKTAHYFHASAGTQVRDFLYINDLCHILYLLLEIKDLPPQLIISSGIPITVKDFLLHLPPLIPGSQIIFDKELQREESSFLVGDPSLLFKLLPQLKLTDIASGLSQTIKSMS